MSVTVATEILIVPCNAQYAALQPFLLLFSSGNFPKGFLHHFFLADTELITILSVKGCHSALYREDPLLLRKGYTPIYICSTFKS